jgi:ribonuclease D
MAGKPTQNLKTRWPSHRSPHRRAADRQAHAEKAPPPPVLQHALVPEGDVPIVDSQDGLLGLIRELRDAGRFGYDTEFIGEETFYSRFCVVQVATERRITLIDALAEGVDLRPFWELLAEPAVEKIVHAGLQDLEPVQRITGRPPANVFDTQIAAGFVGQPYPVSLTNLCGDLLGADLGKSSKFSQWDRRPLSDHQKGYAANDVRYLLLLRRRIGERLAELGHTDKAAAECGLFADPEVYRVDPLQMKLKAKGAGSLRRAEQAVVNALLRWRAEVAEAQNLPMRTLLEDAVLVELGRSPVSSVAEVKKFKGLPWPVKENFAEPLVRVTQEALAGPLPKRRRSFKPLSDAAQAQLDAAWAAAQDRCRELSIAPSLALTKREMTALVRAHSKGQPPPETRLGTGWRRQVLAPVLGELLGEHGPTLTD